MLVENWDDFARQAEALMKQDPERVRQKIVSGYQFFCHFLFSTFKILNREIEFKFNLKSFLLTCTDSVCHEVSSNESQSRAESYRRQSGTLLAIVEQHLNNFNIFEKKLTSGISNVADSVAWLTLFAFLCVFSVSSICHRWTANTQENHQFQHQNDDVRSFAKGWHNQQVIHYGVSHNVEVHERTLILGTAYVHIGKHYLVTSLCSAHRLDTQKFLCILHLCFFSFTNARVQFSQ